MTAPTLRAELLHHDGDACCLRVWCPHCRRFHYHGRAGQRDRVIGGYCVSQGGISHKLRKWRLIPGYVGDVGVRFDISATREKMDRETTRIWGEAETYPNVPNVPRATRVEIPTCPTCGSVITGPSCWRCR